MADDRSRARGMLLGLAVGDALGCTTEGWTADRVRKRFESNLEFEDSFSVEEALKLPGMVNRRDLERMIRQWRRGGVYQDDAQRGLQVAYLLGRSGDITGQELAEEFLQLAGIPVPGPYFGVFRGTSDGFRTAVIAYRQSRDWQQCGLASSGNGAATRVAPIGFFYRSDVPRMGRRCFETSIVTHRDPRALAGAYAVAWMTAGLASAEEWPGFPLLARLRDAVRDAESGLLVEWEDHLLATGTREQDFTWMLDRMLAVGTHDTSAMLAEIVRAARERTRELISSPADPSALCSVVAAIVVTLAHGSEGMEAALRKVIELGGDADATGAMVGAMCGAFHGEEGIPARWRGRIANAEAILRYADALVGPMQRDLPDPIRVESELCSDEEQHRAAISARVLGR